MKELNQTVGIAQETEVSSFLAQEVPEDFFRELKGDWKPPRIARTKALQLRSLLLKAGGYIAGTEAVPAGTTEDVVRAEAGRVLNYLRQSMGSGDFWDEINYSDRAALQETADMHWRTGGEAANAEWNKIKDTVATTPHDKNPKSERFSVLEVSEHIPDILDSMVNLVESRIALLEDVPGVGGLKSIRSMLQRVASTYIPRLRSDLAEVVGREAIMAETYSKFVQKSIVPILDGLERGGSTPNKSPVTEACSALYAEFTGRLAGHAGVEQITVEHGQGVDYETMEPSESVDKDDPRFSGSYKGPETVAGVEQTGYKLSNSFSPKELPVISKAKVFVFNN